MPVFPLLSSICVCILWNKNCHCLLSWKLSLTNDNQKETWKQNGSCQKIQGSKQREIKLISNDEVDE